MKNKKAIIFIILYTIVIATPMFAFTDGSNTDFIVKELGKFEKIIFRLMGVIYLLVIASPMGYILFQSFRVYKNVKNSASLQGEGAKDTTADVNKAIGKQVFVSVVVWFYAYGMLGQAIFFKDTMGQGFDAFYGGFFTTIKKRAIDPEYKPDDN